MGVHDVRRVPGGLPGVHRAPAEDHADAPEPRARAGEDAAASCSARIRNIERQSNPWGIANDQRMDWAKDLDVPTIEENPDPEYILWVGCAGAFDSRIIKQTRAMVKVLNTAGVDYAVLGHSEACTGDPARRTGNEMLFQMLAEQNVETLKAANAKKVVTSCPHCLHTLRHDYPQFGGNFEVVHHTQLIDHLYKTGALKSEHVAGRHDHVSRQLLPRPVEPRVRCAARRHRGGRRAERRRDDAQQAPRLLLRRRRRPHVHGGARGPARELQPHRRDHRDRRRGGRGRLPVLQHHADRRHEAAQRRGQDRRCSTSPSWSRRASPTCRSIASSAARTAE